MLNTCRHHAEHVRLAAELGQLLEVDLVHRGVVCEQPRAAGGQPIPVDQPLGQALSPGQALERMAASTSANT
jgi:hypothetical protein